LRPRRKQQLITAVTFRWLTLKIIRKQLDLFARQIAEVEARAAAEA
jgi:hypothetical protein